MNRIAQKYLLSLYMLADGDGRRGMNKNLGTVQGGWETDEDVESAAARETVEEAGVRGRLEVRDAHKAVEGRWWFECF